MKKVVDIGCGKTKRTIEDYPVKAVIGIDIFPYDGVNIVCNLGFEAIPIEDNEIDHVLGYDFLEHLPFLYYWGGKRIYPIAYLFSEVWRILKKGGIFECLVPVFPLSKHIYSPEHKSIWTEETILLFVDYGDEKMQELFGIDKTRLFKLQSKRINREGKLYAELRK